MARLKKTSTQENTTTNLSPESLPFESALEELETVVEQLEHDECQLEEALTCFERGIKLMRICDAHLNHARGKITELIKGEDGAFAEKILGTSLEAFLNEKKQHD